MPASLKINVKRKVKEEGDASVSELFRDAFRALEEEELYNSVLRSEKEFSQRKGRRLRSLRDLM